jgi:DNA excision repair protein ERCC-2
MCIHPRVNQEGDRETVDSLCRNMTASWVREKAHQSAASGCGGDGQELCGFYEGYAKEGAEAGDNIIHPTVETFTYFRYFFFFFTSEVPVGVFALDDLKDIGAKKGIF